MNHGHFAIITVAVFPAAQGGNKFVHHIVYVNQMHHHRRVVHPDGLVMGDVVAESGHRAVIVGAAPFAEHIREAVHQYLCTRFPGVLEQQLLPCPLRFTVRVVECGLRGRGNHYRTGIAVLLQCIKQRGGEAEVPLHKLRRILGTVHACQIEDKVSLSAIDIQFGRVTVHVIFVNGKFLTCNAVIAGFPVTDVVQLGYKVPADKPSGAGH